MKGSLPVHSLEKTLPFEKYVKKLLENIIAQRILDLFIFVIVLGDHDSTGPTSTFTASKLGSC